MKKKKKNEALLLHSFPKKQTKYLKPSKKSSITYPEKPRKSSITYPNKSSITILVALQHRPKHRTPNNLFAIHIKQHINLIRISDNFHPEISQTTYINPQPPYQHDLHPPLDLNPLKQKKKKEKKSNYRESNLTHWVWVRIFEALALARFVEVRESDELKTQTSRS